MQFAAAAASLACRVGITRHTNAGNSVGKSTAAARARGAHINPFIGGTAAAAKIGRGAGRRTFPITTAVGIRGTSTAILPPQFIAGKIYIANVVIAVIIAGTGTFRNGFTARSPRAGTPVTRRRIIGYGTGLRAAAVAGAAGIRPGSRTFAGIGHAASPQALQVPVVVSQVRV